MCFKGRSDFAVLSLLGDVETVPYTAVFIELEKHFTSSEFRAFLLTVGVVECT